MKLRAKGRKLFKDVEATGAALVVVWLNVVAEVTIVLVVLLKTGSLDNAIQNFLLAGIWAIVP